MPDPIRGPGGWREAARIEKEIAGEIRVHQMCPADTFTALEEARTLSVAKAKRAIDRSGDALFG